MQRETPEPAAVNPRASSSEKLSIRYQSPAAIHPNPHNSRTHSKQQVRQLAKSIKRFGFTNPILVDSKNVILAGQGRWDGTKSLGMEQVPTISLADLTPDQTRAYLIADNALAQKAGWDDATLAIELQHLVNLEDFDVSLTGFEVPEIDLILEQFSAQKSWPNEVIELKSGPPVTRSGDLWTMGKHSVICGSALEESTLTALMGDFRANVVFTDPPYNVAIDGNVCGKGSIHHREFAMASGEFDRAQYVTFLTTSLSLLARFTLPGSIVFTCMDWRHISELLEAGKHSLGEHRVGVRRCSQFSDFSE